MGKSEKNQPNGRKSTSTSMNDWIRGASGFGPPPAADGQQEPAPKIPTANAGAGAHSVVEVPPNMSEVMGMFLRGARLGGPKTLTTYAKR